MTETVKRLSRQESRLPGRSAEFNDIFILFTIYMVFNYISKS